MEDQPRQMDTASDVDPSAARNRRHGEKWFNKKGLCPPRDELKRPPPFLEGPAAEGVCISLLPSP